MTYQRCHDRGALVKAAAEPTVAIAADYLASDRIYQALAIANYTIDQGDRSAAAQVLAADCFFALGDDVKATALYRAILWDRNLWEKLPSVPRAKLLRNLTWSGRLLLRPRRLSSLRARALRLCQIVDPTPRLLQATVLLLQAISDASAQNESMSNVDRMLSRVESTDIQELWLLRQLIMELPKPERVKLLPTIERIGSERVRLEPVAAQLVPPSVSHHVFDHLLQRRLEISRELFGDEDATTLEALARLVTYYRFSEVDEVSSQIDAKDLSQQVRAFESSVTLATGLDASRAALRRAAPRIVGAQYEAALDDLRPAIEAENHLVKEVLGQLTSRQRIGLMDTIRPTFDLLVTLTLASPKLKNIALAYNAVLRRKAILLVGARGDLEARLMAEGNKELQKTLAKIAKLRSQQRAGALMGLSGPGAAVLFELSDRSINDAQMEVGEEELRVTDSRALNVAVLVAHMGNTGKRWRRLERLERKVREHVPEYALRAAFEDATLERVRRCLPKRTALLEFVRFKRSPLPRTEEEDAYCVFVLRGSTDDRPQLVDLGPAWRMDRAIRECRASITFDHERIVTPPDHIPDETPLLEPNTDPAALLEREILHLIEESIEECSEVIIVPDGEFARLPFDVLKCHDGVLWGERYSWSMLTSGRELIRESFAVTTPSRALVIANPDFDLDADGEKNDTVPDDTRARYSKLNFSALPGTQAEGEAVATRLGVPCLSGASALVSQVTTCRSPAVLHLATHGLFLEEPVEPSSSSFPTGRTLHGVGLEDPFQRSVLAMAGANTWLRGGWLRPNAGHGFLTAEEVTRLDLRATELVVLSACETGLGDIRTGEGVLGLIHAFLVAGAHSVVASLWRIPDDDTAQLMTTFYEAVLGGESVAQALSDAKRIMSNEGKEPLSWAGIVCYGNRGPLARFSRGRKKDRPASLRSFWSSHATGHAPGTTSHFEELVRRTGMSFTLPPQYEQHRFSFDWRIEVDYSIRSEKTGLVIGYVVRPVREETAALGEDSFLEILTSIGQVLGPLQRYDEGAAEAEFGVDWARFAFADFSESGSDYDILACALHKDTAGTAIVFHVGRDPGVFREIQNRAVFNALRFVD